ncbi:hypothetical protein GF407_14025 [candidate division KSB1 bacterium]|nr:hypothetical protein [candidate division KSB1 bacterium]
MTTAHGKQIRNHKDPEKGLPRNPRIKFHFKRQEFDFFFQWIVGMKTHGGVQIGEAYYAASQIKEGDMQSWIREWNAMGERVERRAEVSQQNNHPVSARESYLRCYTYYRVPLLFINPIAEPQRFTQQYEQSSHMKEAAETIKTVSPHPRNKTVLMPADEGADSHGISTNLALLSQVTFDWLDEMLV